MSRRGSGCQCDEQRKVEPMKNKAIQTAYDAKYARGDGWKYDLLAEKKKLAALVVAPAEIKKGAKVLELGCGEGVHARALHCLGMKVTAIDYSQVAIAHAEALQPGPDFLCMDVSQYLADNEDSGEFDAVLIRGLTWYHYKLTGMIPGGISVPEATAKVCSLLRAGGVFALQICSDFSGKDKQGGVRNNTLAEYLALAKLIGSVVSCTDWAGKPLACEKDTEGASGGVVLVVRKG